MISEAKKAANRRNAQLSIGPKSDEGKDRSSQNSLKHGLSSQKPLIPGENEAEHEAFRKEILDALRPPGALETLLAERIINAAWRLRRFGPIEAQILSREWADVLEQSPDQEETALGSTFLRASNDSEALARLHRYEMGLERSLYRALKELQVMRLRQSDKTNPPSQGTGVAASAAKAGGMGLCLARLKACPDAAGAEPVEAI